MKAHVFSPRIPTEARPPWLRSAVQYHDRQVELYAEFDPAFLLKFLRQSQYIDWAKAREVCRARGLTRATVFIMGRCAMASPPP